MYTHKLGATRTVEWWSEGTDDREQLDTVIHYSSKSSVHVHCIYMEDKLADID
jgi:hypothetical protein